ncbi:MAG: hypothetical protein ACK2UY_00930 [Anaerolineae bacterium]
MRVFKTEGVRRNMGLAVAGTALMLVVVLSMVVAADETEPTWAPPEIAKWASPTDANVGDPVQFPIVVENPLYPPVGYSETVTWYQVIVTDVVVAEFNVTGATIVEYEGAHSPPQVERVGNVITATLAIMEPGDYFLLRINTLLAASAESGTYVRNEARVSYYRDIDGRLGREYRSDDAQVFVGNRVMLPLVGRNFGP